MVACLPCNHSASRVLRIPSGDGHKRPPLTPSLRRHGKRQCGQAGLPQQTATTDGSRHDQTAPTDVASRREGKERALLT